MILIESALMCLAMNVYAESRGESIQGQTAVALVTLNRAHYEPSRICSEVYKPRQFSWTNKRARLWYAGVSVPVGYDATQWRQSVWVARCTLYGRVHDFTNGATYYHATSVQPAWRLAMLKTTKIGHHVFYKTKSQLTETS